MDFPTEVEADFDVWFAQQNRANDFLSLLIVTPAAIAHILQWPDAGAAALSLLLLFLNLFDLKVMLQQRERHARQYRQVTFSIRWVAVTLVGATIFDHLERAIQSGDEGLLLRGLALTKWPYMFAIMCFFRLKVTLLPTIWLVFLLGFHYSALKAVEVPGIGQAMRSSQMLQGIVRDANRALSAITGGFPVKVCVEQYVLVYCLLLQSLVFWGLLYVYGRREMQQRRLFLAARQGATAAVGSMEFWTAVRRCAGVQAYVVCLLIYAVEFKYVVHASKVQQ